ncbi:hypothetical protein EK904_013236 [Melospiza melodia maxima]|nr:hypothetical protein EK904_013236 [Melospiza melodia maxima]
MPAPQGHDAHGGAVGTCRRSEAIAKPCSFSYGKTKQELSPYLSKHYDIKADAIGFDKCP